MPEGFPLLFVQYLNHNRIIEELSDTKPFLPSSFCHSDPKICENRFINFIFLLIKGMILLLKFLNVRVVFIHLHVFNLPYGCKVFLKSEKTFLDSKMCEGFVWDTRIYYVSALNACQLPMPAVTRLSNGNLITYGISIQTFWIFANLLFELVIRNQRSAKHSGCDQNCWLETWHLQKNA